MIWLAVTVVAVLVAIIAKKQRVSNILVVVAIVGFVLTIISQVIVTEAPTTHYKEIVEKDEEKLVPINSFLPGYDEAHKEYFCATTSESGYMNYFVLTKGGKDLLFINPQDCVFTTSKQPFIKVIRYTFENPIHFLLAFSPNSRITVIGLPEDSFFTGFTISKPFLKGN